MAKRPRKDTPHFEGHSDAAEEILAGADASLLDLVDHIITQGVVLSGDVVFGLAGIDLVYLRVAALLGASDRLLPGGKLPGGKPE